MNRVIALFIVLSSLLLAVPPSMAAAQQKVGIVNLQKCLNLVEEGKKTMATLKAEADSKKNQLEALKAEIKRMKDEIDKQKMVLSQEALGAKTNEIQTKFLDLQQKAMQFDQELKAKEAQSVQKIIVSLKTVVADIAKKDHFDIVYENSADTILYTSQAVDLTDAVIKAFNARK